MKRIPAILSALILATTAIAATTNRPVWLDGSNGALYTVAGSTTNIIPIGSTNLSTWGASNLTIGGVFSGDSVSNIFYLSFPPYIIPTNAEPLFMSQGFPGYSVDIWKQRRDATSWWVAAHNGSAFETNQYKLSYVLPAIWSNQTYVSYVAPTPADTNLLFYPLTNNILAQWDFQSTNGTDSSKNHYDLTLSGPSLVLVTTNQYGYTNNAFYFDGVDDVAFNTNNSSSVLSNPTFTVSMWLYQTNFSSVMMPFAVVSPTTNSGDTAQQSIVLEVPRAVASGEPRFMNFSNNISAIVFDSIGTSFSVSGAWWNVVGVFSNRASIYTNGAFCVAGSASANKGLASCADMTKLGYLKLCVGAYVNSYNSGLQFKYKGIIDNVCIWSTNLTPAQVTNVFAVSNPNNDLHIGVNP